ncbi:MAG: DUF4280 domain-containing protein [Halanaerobiaceae bacterium]|nr:DUF4280 domain-containing protein [Halanaerobiaceae bacterium]
MAEYVCEGALLKCSFGDEESKLKVPVNNRVYIRGNPVARMTDNIPLTNIQAFGNCSSLVNPTVAAATAANGGVLKKMPCVPVIPAPWIEVKTNTTSGSIPLLTTKSKLMCMWAGVIEVKDPG